jgi:hypothetical protein
MQQPPDPNYKRVKHKGILLMSEKASKRARNQFNKMWLASKGNPEQIYWEVDHLIQATVRWLQSANQADLARQYASGWSSTAKACSSEESNPYGKSSDLTQGVKITVKAKE